MLRFDPHPLLDAGVFVTDFPAPLGDLATPEEVLRLLALDAPAPLARDEDARKAVRDLLRRGGYKPTGRGKPASEYLVRAAGEGALRSINLAVDACNAVSLASGLPISVVDFDRAAPPLVVRVAPEDTRYVFNPSGQEIRIDGLIALFDAEGACANAVKDSQRTKTSDATQRTKTSDATRRTLSVVWGTSTLPGRTEEATRWYRELLEGAGATTRDAREASAQ